MENASPRSVTLGERGLSKMLKPFTWSLALAVVCAMHPLAAQESPPSSREVPARAVPVPTTVSPQKQAVSGAPFSTLYNRSPQNADEWKTIVKETAQAAAARLPKL